LPAQSFVSGEGYRVPDQREAYHNRTPGYPVFLTPFLATFSEDSYHHVVIWVQRLMWIGLILFLMPPISSQKSKLGFWSALIGKALCVFALPVLLASSKVLSDIPHAFFVGLGILLFLKWKNKQSWWLAEGVGLSLMCAILIRPVSLLLPYLLLAYGLIFVFADRKMHEDDENRNILIPISQLLIIVLLPLLAVAGWSYRNKMEIDTFGYSPLTGYNLCLRQESTLLNWANSPENRIEGLSEEEVEYLEHVREEGDVIRARGEMSQSQGLNQFEIDDIMKSVALKSIKDAPLPYLKGCVIEMVNIFGSSADFAAVFNPNADLKSFSELRREGNYLGMGTRLFFKALFPLIYGIIPFCLLLYRVVKKQQPLEALFLIFVAAYYIGLSAAVIPTYSRFLIPVLPVICLAYMSLGVRDITAEN